MDYRKEFRVDSGDKLRLNKLDPAYKGKHPSEADPHAEPYRSILEKAWVYVIDLTAINAEDVTHHGKFAQSEVVKAIGQRLANGQTLTKATLTLEKVSAVSRAKRGRHTRPGGDVGGFRSCRYR